MYASKRAGRNRVAGPETESGPRVGVMAPEASRPRPEVVEPPV
jgi:hypothetical protein